MSNISNPVFRIFLISTFSLLQVSTSIFTAKKQVCEFSVFGGTKEVPEKINTSFSVLDLLGA